LQKEKEASAISDMGLVARSQKGEGGIYPPSPIYKEAEAENITGEI